MFIVRAAKLVTYLLELVFEAQLFVNFYKVSALPLPLPFVFAKFVRYDDDLHRNR